nr:translational initiation factor 1 [Prunus persica f. compressa]
MKQKKIHEGLITEQPTNGMYLPGSFRFEIMKI